jgi:hypothetical protein
VCGATHTYASFNVYTRATTGWVSPARLAYQTTATATGPAAGVGGGAAGAGRERERERDKVADIYERSRTKSGCERRERVESKREREMGKRS